jgi:hypothetical protein
MSLDLEHELDRRLALSWSTEEKIKVLEFILRLALKRLEAKHDWRQSHD